MVDIGDSVKAPGSNFWIETQDKLGLLAWLLVFAFVFLQPVGRAYEAPYNLLAVLGLFVWVRLRKSIFNDATVRQYSLLFLLFFIPVIISNFGAQNPYETARVSLVSLRIFFAGIAILLFVRSRGSFVKLEAAVAIVLIFWLLNGVIQAATGHDILGDIPPENRLSSFYYRHPLKFGMITAVFSPLLLVAAYRRGLAWLFTCLILLSGVVLFAGSRGGWLCLAIVVAGLVVYHVFVTKKITWLFVAASILCVIVLSVVGYSTYSPFKEKVDQSLLLLSGDEHSINRAITYRVPIWRTAWRMFQDNPLIGVGARGFRYAYEEYALPQDLVVEPHSESTGANHAHQMLLDVAAETGSVGLLGVVGLWLVASIMWLRATARSKEKMLPYGLALLAVFFPFNTHFATYSSSWSVTIFCLIALYCSASRDETDEHLTDGISGKEPVDLRGA